MSVAPEVRERVERLVGTFVDGVTTADVRSEAYRRLVADIGSIGAREIAATAEMSDRLLRRPVRAMTGLLQGKSTLTRTVGEFRHIVEELDPARHALDTPRARALGVIPVGSGMERYLDRYRRAQPRINELIDTLEACQDEIRQDNAAIGQEEQALSMEIETLRQYAYMAERMDDAIESRIDAIEPTDADRARTLREDVLFPVRQRRQEILTQLAVAIQGFAALRVVEQNNEALDRAVRGATTTTVAALRTTVMVAQALADRRLVAEQVRQVDEVTRTMIEDAAVRRARPGSDLAALKNAWDGVFAALDSIDMHRVDALQAMKLSVQELAGQVERTRASLERLEQDGTRRSS